MEANARFVEPQLRLEVTVRQLTKKVSVTVQNPSDGDTASRCSTLSLAPYCFC